MAETLIPPGSMVLPGSPTDNGDISKQINSMVESLWKSGRYRPDIDGLRALAVLGVVFFHARLGFPGGYVGVDVFFVISGYLISGIILRELDRENFSFIGFWERRIRRIFPALFVTMAATLLFGWFCLLPFSYLVLSQAVVSILLLVSNVQFWRTSGYFSPAAEENPMLHTWSLSVEEQFYLVAPILIVLLWRLKMRNAVIIGLSITTMVSFLCAVWWVRRDQEGAFYLLPSRWWEIGLGGLLGFLRAPKSKSSGFVSGGAGVLMISAAYIFFDATTLFPGLSALLPVCGAALVIWAGAGEQHMLGKLLSQPWLVLVGKVSYSFYLWHWPFFAFHRQITGRAPEWAISGLYVILAFLLSLVSWRWIETPFRKGKKGGGRIKVFACASAAAFVAGIFALWIYQSGGAAQRVPGSVRELDAANRDEYMDFDRFVTLSEGVRLRVFGDGDPEILVWGDSHALAMLPAVEAASRDTGVTVVAAELGGCAPVLDWVNREECRATHERFNERVFEYISEAKDRGLRKVVFAFFWSSYFDDQVTPYGFSKPMKGFPEAFLATIRRLESMEVEITILREIPIYPVHVARSAALHEWYGAKPPSLADEDYKQYQGVYDVFLNALESNFPEVEIREVADYLLGEEGKFEYINENGYLLYKDQSHLTRVGALRFARLFRQIFVKG